MTVRSAAPQVVTLGFAAVGRADVEAVRDSSRRPNRGCRADEDSRHLFVAARTAQMLYKVVVIL